MAGFRDFQTGEVLTAANVNDFLAKQAVMKFADSSARDTALGTAVGGSNALREGMVAYLDDTDAVQVYDGSSWAAVGSDPNAGIGSNVASVALTSALTTSIATATFADISGLQVSITPSSATSKILLIAHVNASVGSPSASVNVGPYFRFNRNGTPIGIGDAAGSRARSSFGGLGSAGADEHESNFAVSMMFLDSPATTSAVTYKLQASHRSTSTAIVAVNRSKSDPDAARIDRNISTLTAIEVAA